MTVVPRKGRFGVKVYDPGTKRPRWIGTFQTRAEAEQAQKDATLTPGKNVPTVEQWGRIWLSDYSRPAPATRMVYKQAVKTISQSIGAKKLDGVDRLEARRLANTWPRNTSAVARTMWGDAVRDQICKENPWENLRLKQSRGRKDIVALTESQLHELADIAERVHGEYGSEAKAIILTLGYVGIRPGELCALRREDIDLTNREMTVKRSVDATGAEKLPKNGRVRCVTIPPPAIAAIRSMPASTNAYVFHSYTGRRLNKPNLWYVWKPIKTVWLEAGNRDMDLYDLRHSAATALAERGVDASTIAVQLGHTDGGALCMKLYCHPSEERARERLKMAYAETPQDARMRRTA